jgi:hypothetical protein
MTQPAADPRDVEMRFVLVQQRYGDRLSAGQLEAIRQAVQTIADHVAALRTVRLTNADEPLARFIPFRADE